MLLSIFHFNLIVSGDLVGPTEGNNAPVQQLVLYLVLSLLSLTGIFEIPLFSILIYKKKFLINWIVSKLHKFFFYFPLSPPP